MAQWIRLLLPSCRPGFESQAHHLNFYKCNVVKTKINEKEAGIGPFFKKGGLQYQILHFLLSNSSMGYF